VSVIVADVVSFAESFPTSSALQYMYEYEGDLQNTPPPHDFLATWSKRAEKGSNCYK